MAKFPKFSQWKQLFKILRGSERIIFLILAVLAVVSATYLTVNFYINNTKMSPAYGGEYTEGLVGQPRFINPIYGETNDIDRTLINLTYSGLMTYDNNGKIATDLVKDYKISENGKIYTFQLKNNLFWQDGTPLTADDVIFTIKTIKNSDYKSPLRANWLNVEAEKISDNSFSFSLGSPYNSFLENCTVKIIPQHIWKNVLPENFSLSLYNLQPIGSGPYILTNLQEGNAGFIKSIALSSNPKYHDKKPYISKINFNFFGNKNDLTIAANQKTIEGFSVSDLDDNQALAEKNVRQGWTQEEKFKVYNFSLPRYFAVFFNTNPPTGVSQLLSDSNTTKALNYSVNKEELIKKIGEIYKESPTVVNSPILPDYFNYSDPKIYYNYDLSLANKLLDKSGYKYLEGSTIRSKTNNKKPAFQFGSYLSIGSKSSEVTKLQECLSRLDDNFKNLLATETNGKYGESTAKAVTAFQEKYLAGTKSTGEVGSGTRQKLNELCFANQSSTIPLQFTLTTVNQQKLIDTANLLKDYWQKVGVTVVVKAIDASELKDTIKNRDYDALLYGQALGSIPDLYPFWHSTQIKDPGLNLASYQNKTADQLLKDAREVADEQVKIKKYESLQDVILGDAPVLLLYNPDYIYWVSGKIKGIDTTKIIDPAKRFSNIINWYIKTKRVWK